MNAAPEIDPGFETTAVACFREAFGQPALDEFRDLLEEADGMSGLVVMQLANRLNLSANDQQIFRAVAKALKRHDAGHAQRT
jgi:hypothetical protein